ncbi:MAG: aspartate/tyrosine/aromatic aminotransferase [Rhodobacteraceae bacterium]|nr:aspartate/tyrosine/aromatic aminotransferase [Paracoccaceae bacterium]
MLNALQKQPEDKIIQLMQLFRDDPRSDKVDLGVGVYKDATGLTPVMRAIKSAEQKLWQAETTKTYTALAGDVGYHDVMIDLVLGNTVPRERIAAAATPGGTGAIHMVLELVQKNTPDATIWISAPTWPNHPSIIRHMGLKLAEYRYFDEVSRAVDFDAMLADLKQVKAGDVVLLHGCCHNPTGANLNNAQWQQIAETLLAQGAMPFVDIAYQGFGNGLEEDAFGVRLLAKTFPELLIAASCSKNFGIYRERTGAVMIIAPDKATRDVVQGNLAHLNRLNFSFPPDHGARLVTMILSDPALKAEWMAELEEVRLGMLALRQQLADELRRLSGSDRFGFVAEHRGMFSRMGATPEQVLKMREKHGIYMIGDSRINIAGLNKQSVPILAKALIEVGV